MSTPNLPNPAGAVEQAIDHARRTGQPATVRVHLSLDPSVDPWALLGHPELAQRQVFAWADDIADRCFLAVAVLRAFDLDGARRFVAAEDLVGELRSSCFDVPWVGDTDIAQDAPLVVGGFSFESTEQRSGTWQGWADSTLWLPHALVQRHQGRAVLVVTERVDASSDATEVMDELRRNLERVHAAIERPHPAHPSEPALGGPSAGRDAADHASWTRRVQAARDTMTAGAFDKVVVARSESWQTRDGQRFDPFATAVALRERQARCTTFAFCREDGSAFVGATPELLVRLDGGQLCTTALAGTARQDPDTPTSELALRLLGSAKDRHEQGLVTQAIEASLRPIADTLSIPDQPTIVELADVLHLETQIRGQLGAHHGLFELVGRLHPTPAVGGLPRQPALRWRAEHEGLDRGWYSAPMGWADAHGNGTFVVAIRSVLLRNGTATTFAGCGIVPESDPEAEWGETLSKLATVRHGLSVTAR